MTPAPRAREIDRSEAVDTLDVAYGSGQLTAQEHSARVASAVAATTLAQLRRLVSDLQTPTGSAGTRFQNPRPQPPVAERARAGTPAGAALTAMLVAAALACGISLVMMLGIVSPETTTGPEASRDSLHSAAALGRMLDDIEREFGDLTVSEMRVHADHATISRPIADKPGQDQNYHYEVTGGASHLEEQGVSSRSDHPPTDLAALRQNLSRVVGLMYGAGQSLAVPDPASMYLLIGEDGPGVAMYLRNKEQGASGHMTVGFDGAVTSIRRADR